MSSQFQSECYTFYPSDPSVFPTTAKRLWKPDSPTSGITLVCVHSNGSHKEAYEPFICDLFELIPSNIIREVWLLDLPNHGDAAVINERKLLTAPYNQNCESYIASPHV